MALLTPLVFTRISFNLDHYYPVEFPVSMFAFGQFGMYAALLTLALVAFGKNKSGAFLLGLMPAIHLPWAIAAWLGAGAIFIARRATIVWRPLLTSLAVGLGIFVISLAGHLQMMKHVQVFDAPKTDVATLTQLADSLSAKWCQRTMTGGLACHDALLRDSTQPWKEAAKYFTPDFLFLLIALLGFTVFKHEMSFAVRGLLLAMLAVTGIAMGYKIVEEILPSFNFLRVISPNLPFYLKRLIIGRWLNLNVLLWPAFLIGSIGYLALIRRNAVAGLGLIMLVILQMTGLHWRAFPNAVTLGSLPTVLLAAAVVLGFFVSKDGLLRRVQLQIPEEFFRKCVSGVLLAAVFLAVLAFLLQAMQLSLTKPYKVFGADQYDELAAKAKEDDGTLLLGPGVKSYHGFNPQLRTRRPILLGLIYAAPNVSPLMFLFEKVDTTVYCFSIFDCPPPDLVTHQKSCWQARPLSEWQTIKNEFGATSVIVRDDWELSLTKLAACDGLILYRIP